MGAGTHMCEVRDSLTCFGVSGTAAVGSHGANASAGFEQGRVQSSYL